MALRAFHANPSLGGFGGESSGPLRVNSQATEQDCDAFAQIVKELVDNAVDACQNTNGRIRVVIERMNGTNDDEEYRQDDRVLRVTVSDSGVGMKSIQDCVNAFRTSKAGNDEQSENTAGRIWHWSHAMSLACPTTCAKLVCIHYFRHNRMLALYTC